MRTGWEKLNLAVLGAATSDATLQDNIESSNVPPQLWERLQKLRYALTREATAGKEGTAYATTNMMSDEEATKWLHEIVSLYNGICEAHYGSP